MKKLFLILITLSFSLIINAQNTSIWGVTPNGGNGAGCIFRTNSQGENLNVEYSLPGVNSGYDGDNATMVASPNGKLYGFFSRGGVNDEGVVYSYDPSTNTYSKLTDFSDVKYGKNPYGKPLLASNGKLYGVCYFGGEYNFGTIFEYNIQTGNLQKLHDFNGSNGKWPMCSLVQASNGKIYGTTTYGGNNDNGVIFEYDYTNSGFVKKYNFSNSSLWFPSGNLVEVSTNKFIGLAEFGGAGTWTGGIYEYTLGDSSIVNKQNLSCKFYQHPALTKSQNGKVYAALYYTGVSRIMEYNPANGALTFKHYFSINTGTHPVGELNEISSGVFIGALQAGGTYGAGGVYIFNTNTDSVNIFSEFKDSTTSVSPLGGLTISGNKYYGISARRAINLAPKVSVIYEVDYNNSSIAAKLDLNKYPNGSKILNGLAENKDGILYGITEYGNQMDNGGIFTYDTLLKTSSVVYSNSSQSYAQRFRLGPVFASNGYLYTILNDGGEIASEFRPQTMVLNRKYFFYNSQSTIGFNVSCPFIQGNNSDLWSATAYGGAHSKGSLFVYSAGGHKAWLKYTFEGGLKGYMPSGRLCYTSAGLIYGMTRLGGQDDCGVLFEFNPSTNVYTKKFDFDSINGSTPVCGMVEYSPGVLYGTTTKGGANNYGILFKYDISNSSLSKIIDFTGANGRYPSGQLLLASNNKIYGVTTAGGANESGVIFEFNPATNTIATKSDFTESTGHPGPNTNLTELGTNIGIKEVKTFSYFRLYPNPATNSINIELTKTFNSLKVNIYDAYGKIVMEKHYTSSKNIAMDLNLLSGIYFIKVFSDNKLLGTEKLLIYY